jgi:tRNA pseudouridine38/39 synthase
VVCLPVRLVIQNTIRLPLPTSSSNRFPDYPVGEIQVFDHDSERCRLAEITPHYGLVYNGSSSPLPRGSAVIVNLTMASSSSSHANKQLYHTLLGELQLISVDKAIPRHQLRREDEGSGRQVSALEILNQLLNSNLLTPTVLREAHNAVLLQQKQIGHDAEQRQHDTPDNTAAGLANAQCKGDSQALLLARQQHEQSPLAQPQVRTRHIALRFYYDGANYTGLAQNVGQDHDQSVERALFQALTKAQLVPSREASGYSRCGRTDRGVSAAGQVVAFQHMKSAIPMDATWDAEGTQSISKDQLPKNPFETITVWVLPKNKTKTNKKDKKKINEGETNGTMGATMETIPTLLRQEKQLSEYPYAKILNNLLPPDIRVLGWSPVSDDFSARFSATTRTYRYFFVPRQMNLTKMQEGLDLLVGKHDFRNFCKMDVEKVYNFVRLIHSAQVVSTTTVESGNVGQENLPNTIITNNSQDGRGICYLRIVGQAFLWHQIRCIASILFLVGQGLEPPSVVTELLNVDRYPGKPSYPLAPERPLVLHKCGYPNLHIGYSVQNIWSTSCQLEQQWEDLQLAAARIRNCIQSWEEDVTVLKNDLIQFATAKLHERQKKRRRQIGHYGQTTDTNLTMDSIPTETEESDSSVSNYVSWKDALSWLKDRGFVPDSNGLMTALHIPLLERSMGSTYDEKVSALQKSDKRRQKFEENVIKKRKTTAEDAAFYQHMTQQGGTGI